LIDDDEFTDAQKSKNQKIKNLKNQKFKIKN